jgi:hypothetical protein
VVYVNALSSIEDIILACDRRGISSLRKHMAESFCYEAAQLLIDNPGPVIICTGFYILGAGAPETDGPPGAFFLGQALEAFGCPVTYVTDKYAAFLFDGLTPQGNLVEFPIEDASKSMDFADRVLDRIRPSVVIAIERCGKTIRGRYLDMNGTDISDYSAKLDYLISQHDKTIGVGDGGNEIGMGNLADKISLFPGLPKEPATTSVTRLVISSVSNWGAYGLIAALSQSIHINLLPSVADEESLICRLVDLGAVDGILARKVYSVDGFCLSDNRQALENLHVLLAEQ